MSLAWDFAGVPGRANFERETGMPMVRIVKFGEAGNIIDVSDAVAQELIEAGIAVAVEDSAPETAALDAAPEKAVMPSPRNKRRN